MPHEEESTSTRSYLAKSTAAIHSRTVMVTPPQMHVPYALTPTRLVHIHCWEGFLKLSLFLSSPNTVCLLVQDAIRLSSRGGGDLHALDNLELLVVDEGSHT